MNSAALAWAVLCFYVEMMDKTWDALPKIGWALGAWLLGYWILKRVLVRGSSIRAPSIRRAVCWFTIPIVVPSVWLIMRMEIPRRVGFEISRPALNAAAQAAVASPTPLHNQTGGLYQVYEASVYHGHVTLDTEGGEFVRVNQGNRIFRLEYKIS
jgi:hypothetical protein